MAPWVEPSEDEIVEIVRGARVVAVIGMKGADEPWAPAHTVPGAMKRRGIRLIPINPKMREGLGEHALGTVAELQEPPDIIQVFRRSEYVAEHADEILALPAAVRPKVVWLQTGISDERAAAKLEAAGIRVVMDRCFAVDMAKYR
jgi:predicted CoA-binding protein